VPVGVSLRVGAVSGGTRIETPAPVPARPRLRPGWVLRRLGTARYALADLNGADCVRFTAEEAKLLQWLDGRHTVAEIVDAVGAAHGQRLRELLAELVERALIAPVRDPLTAR
jgi:hypothetical protein